MSKNIKEAYEPGEDRDRDGKKWEDYETIKCADGEVVDMVKLIEDQSRATAALMHLEPTLGGLVSKLRIIYTFRVDTQATDGYNLFVNPQFTSHLDMTEKVFVLAHEVLHCLLNHLRRGLEAGHPLEKSNVAADYECNITISDNLDIISYDTIKNKIKALIDKKYSGWGYERIYADNPAGPGQNSQNKSNKSQQGQEGQQGQGGGNQQLDPDYIKGWNEAVKDYMSGKIKI